MKIAVYGEAKRTGIVADGSVYDLKDSCALYLQNVEHNSNPYEAASMLVGESLGKLLNGGEGAISIAKKVADFVQAQSRKNLTGLNGERIAFGIDEVKLQPPISETTKVMCYGGNFADHLAGMLSREANKKVTVEEAKKEGLNSPIWGFYKITSNIMGNEDPLQYPARTKRLDYEGEIAAIIGRKGKDIKSSDHMNYIFGFTMFMDFSIRDSTLDRRGLMNFALNKNFDGSGVLGPWIVTKDEITDPYDLDIVTKVNGEIRQNGNTKNMIRNFGDLMQHVSYDITLNPGDVIASGTPSGTAADSTPPDEQGVKDPAKFLKVGDIVEVSSQKIGMLRNKVVAKVVE